MENLLSNKAMREKVEQSVLKLARAPLFRHTQLLDHEEAL